MENSDFEPPLHCGYTLMGNTAGLDHAEKSGVEALKTVYRGSLRSSGNSFLLHWCHNVSASTVHLRHTIVAPFYNNEVGALSNSCSFLEKLRNTRADCTFYWIGCPTWETRKRNACFAVAVWIFSLMMSKLNDISVRLMNMCIRLRRVKCGIFIGLFVPTMCRTDDLKDNF